MADAHLTNQIRQVHQRSRGTYGSPRIHAELRLDHDICVGRKRVARLMRAAALEGCHRRWRQGLTRRDPHAAPAPDLVNRCSSATAPDRVWTADITYVPTWPGWLYLAVVLDAFSRRVVGWGHGRPPARRAGRRRLGHGHVEPSTGRWAGPPFRQ